VLGAPRDVGDGAPSESAEQHTLGHAVEDVVVAEGGRLDAPPDEAEAELSHERFNFWQLRHGYRSSIIDHR
jgi:hypothetical protein